MNVLLYQEIEEPVTRIILQHAKKLHILPVSIQEVLSNAVIFDKITREQTCIRWILSNGLSITNDLHTLLINRVFQIPRECFQDFSVEDQDYARAEFFAYLMFAVSSFPNLAEKIDRYSLMAPVYPLTTQWRKVKEVSKKIGVPEFFLGKNPSEHFLKQEIISSNLYNFYWWKTSEIKTDSQTLFLFKKPKGNPYLILTLGDNGYIYPLEQENSSRLSKSMAIYIKSQCRLITKNFGYFISEILLFIDQEKVTFGMITNYPFAAQYVDGFEENVVKFLDKYIDDFRENKNIH